MALVQLSLQADTNYLSLVPRLATTNDTTDRDPTSSHVASRVFCDFSQAAVKSVEVAAQPLQKVWILVAQK